MNALRFIENIAARRTSVEVWKNSLNNRKEASEAITSELRNQMAQLLEQRAEAWINENKLIHAGAARKLAEEIREKI